MYLLILIFFILFRAHQSFSDSVQPIDDSSYQCQELDSGYNLLKQKKNGQLVEVSFKKTITKLSKKIKKLEKKIKKIEDESKGKPDTEYNQMMVKVYRLHTKKEWTEQILQSIQCCQAGSYTYDDHSDPGLPVIKTSWEAGRSVGFQEASDRPGETPEEAFSYDNENYFVLSQQWHGTTVTVAIHNSADQQENIAHKPEEFAEAIIQMFHKMWHVFEGFPLDGYVFKVRAAGESDSFVLSQGGVVLSAGDYSHMDQAHEIFHAWNGKTFTYEPNMVDLFQLETWIQEGTTVYYAARIDAEVLRDSLYTDNMNAYWEQYLERRGTHYDLPYAELAKKVEGTEGSEYRTMMWAVDSTINYLLDKQMLELGFNVDDLLRYLYIQYGLEGKKYTQDDIPNILQELTGQSFNDLFDNYLHQNGDLTQITDGNHPYLEHEEESCF